MRRAAWWPTSLSLAGAALVCVIAFGFLGHLHLAFDAFSHFRLHACAALGLVGLLIWRRWRSGGVLAVVIAAAAAIATVAPADYLQSRALTAPATALPAARYRLLQVNVRYDNETPERLLSLIGRYEPDVVAVEEVSQEWRETLARIVQRYPYSIICPPPSHIGGVAILSRRPFAEGAEAECFDRGSMAVATIDFGGRSVDVAAVHFGWPWPFDQPGQLPVIDRAAEGLGSDAIVAGDFNAVPWSETVRRVAEAGALQIVRGIGSSWLPKPLPRMLRAAIGLPIDNVLIKGNVVAAPARKLEDIGSDHLPVLIEFGIKGSARPDEATKATASAAAPRIY